MKVINKTKKTTIAETVIEAKSLKEQSIGLLQYKTPIAMLIKTRFGIHTLFMKYAIDVLVLDQHNRVVKVKENLQPNQIFLWDPKYDTVIELPEGMIKKTKTSIGDVIDFQ